MDSENQQDSNNRKAHDDVHPNWKAQLRLQTLAMLAAKVTGKLKVTKERTANIELAPTPTPTAMETTKPTTSTPKENPTSTTTTLALDSPPMPTINPEAVIVQQESENNDKPLSQKSDDSDYTLQSDQSDSNALKALAAVQTAEDKRYSGEQTLDRILLAHSEQLITSARVELDCNSSRTACELMLQAGSGGVMKSLTAVSDAAMMMGGTDGGEAGGGSGERAPETTPTGSVRSIGSLVCRICHNSENPERLVSPCLCKGSLTYVHIHCLERWISTSRSTVCELCQFQYNTEQTLRYTCFQSLRMWYSRSMSRRALQEDCQMFSLLTLVAFGIIGTLLVGIQYYFLQGQAWGMSRMWTKGWLIFFLFTTLAIYFVNIYMILKSQLSPWYRWWQASRDIKLILENRKPFQFRSNRRLQNNQIAQELSDMADMAQQQQQQQHQNAETARPPAPQAASFTPTAQQPYQPIQPTTVGINTPFHISNMTMPQANAYHLPMSINSIELQSNECNNFDIDDDSAWRLGCGKRSLAKASTSCRGVAVAMHSSQMTTAATIEIPLEGCLYEFETVL